MRISDSRCIKSERIGPDPTVERHVADLSPLDPNRIGTGPTLCEDRKYTTSVIDQSVCSVVATEVDRRYGGAIVHQCVVIRTALESDRHDRRIILKSVVASAAIKEQTGNHP